MLTREDLLTLGESLIRPFHDTPRTTNHRHQPILAYGLDQVGYDFSLSEDVKLFANIYANEIDPKAPKHEAYVTPRIHLTRKSEYYVIVPPNSYLKAPAREYVTLPDDVTGLLFGKNTYSNAGAIINTTTLKPGWQGHPTIQIGNATTLPLRVYLREGVITGWFFRTKHG